MTLDKSGPGSNGSEEVLPIPQSTKIGVSLSDTVASGGVMISKLD